tara:strand:- start:5777 stop:6190 length:414 start_codon:yes stop_codon:yes gene_type:complete
VRRKDSHLPFNINHIHIKSIDPKKTADWWVEAFNFTIVSDVVRDVGDRFITCTSENNMIVRISEPVPGQEFNEGDAGLKFGLEHFGLDSSDLDADILRLENLGATLLESPRNASSTVRVAFMEVPEKVRIELIEVKN